MRMAEDFVGARVLRRRLHQIIRGPCHHSIVYDAYTFVSLASWMFWIHHSHMHSAFALAGDEVLTHKPSHLAGKSYLPTTPTSYRIALPDHSSRVDLSGENNINPPQQRLISPVLDSGDHAIGVHRGMPMRSSQAPLPSLGVGVAGNPL